MELSASLLRGQYELEQQGRWPELEYQNKTKKPRKKIQTTEGLTLERNRTTVAEQIMPWSTIKEHMTKLHKKKGTLRSTHCNFGSRSNFWPAQSLNLDGNHFEKVLPTMAPTHSSWSSKYRQQWGCLECQELWKGDRVWEVDTVYTTKVG